MALKLTKDEIKRRDDYVISLREKASKLEEGVAKFNTDLEMARSDLRQLIEEYNEVSVEAKGFAEDIANRLDEEIENKSEKWQESEKGEAAREFKDAWDQLDLAEMHAEDLLPEDLGEIETTDADLLEELPVEPDSV